MSKYSRNNITKIQRSASRITAHTSAQTIGLSRAQMSASMKLATLYH